jgi:hypothetical protein
MVNLRRFIKCSITSGFSIIIIIITIFPSQSLEPFTSLSLLNLNLPLNSLITHFRRKMKLELSSIIQLLSLGVSATAINLPRQTTPDPGFVCDFTIRTTVVPGQPPSTSRFNNLYLNGGGYKQSHKVKLAPEGGQTWCYNGTHIGNGPVTAPPSTAYGFGLNLEYQENGEDRWSHVWSTNWMASNTPTTSLTGFWKVLPGRKIEWTNKKEDGIRFGGWLGKLANFFLILWFLADKMLYSLLLDGTHTAIVLV